MVFRGTARADSDASDSSAPAHALLDCASEGNLVNAAYLKSINVEPTLLDEPIPLYNGDGKLFCTITHDAVFSLTLGTHVKAMQAFVVDLP
ncbi:hypothetical protein KEM56_003207, partial [Ascosphaera pollenicola]